MVTSNVAWLDVESVAFMEAVTLYPQHGSGCVMGEQVLQRLGFEGSTVTKTMKAQTRILLFNYWITYCILKARKPKFQPMEPVAA